MVLFANINLNQRVEILYQGMLIRGTVRYKGSLNSDNGDWVGLELDTAIGRHNGLYKGIKYFEARHNHGVFVRANDIRFIQNTRRRLYNKYHRVWNSGVDEELFGSSGSVESDELRRSQEFNMKPPNDLFTTLGARYSSSSHSHHHLSGSVSRNIPAATMTRPYSASAPYTYTSVPILTAKNPDKHSWTSVPSIPKTHMPLSAQKRQTSRGWDNVPWTREIAHPHVRQSMKSKSWNDVSF